MLNSVRPDIILQVLKESKIQKITELPEEKNIRVNDKIMEFLNKADKSLNTVGKNEAHYLTIGKNGKSAEQNRCRSSQSTSRLSVSY